MSLSSCRSSGAGQMVVRPQTRREARAPACPIMPGRAARAMLARKMPARVARKMAPPAPAPAPANKNNGRDDDRDDAWSDLYPELRRRHRAGEIPKENPIMPGCPNHVRYEMMHQLGYFLTESSEHFSEYCPWFIKRGREDIIKEYEIPLDEYPRRCEAQVKEWNEQFEKLKRGERIELDKSREYAATIMDAMLTGKTAQIYGNVVNNGAIEDLPADCIVEVPCTVGARGVSASRIGAMPLQLVAMMRTNINVQELTVRALLEENREHIFHAAMFDPHTAAELDLKQIRAMTEELLKAHKEWLPKWTQ